MENYVISYDIRSDERRNKIHKTLRDYALPVQYSVFECRLSKESFVALRFKLEALIQKEEDSIIFYRLCPGCTEKIKRIGVKMDPFGDGIYII
jgi:CRISPR-associated protein Cas2